MYSIYYDDSEYDYMQHLKPVGVTKEAILLDAPTTTKEPPKSQSIQLRATSPGGGEGGQKEGLRLPNSVQPTPHEQMLSYQDHLQYALPSHSAIPDHGLFPLDDDPALREVLEALEDDAYVEEEIQDEFFGTIVKDGEREPDEEPEWIHQIQSSSSSSQWESEMARFKKPHSTSTDTASSIGSLSAASSNKRKLATHQKLQGRDSVNGSAFSMSSSAMFRNEGLTDLDDRFDQVECEFQSYEQQGNSQLVLNRTTGTLILIFPKSID
jgi:protein LTV1